MPARFRSGWRPVQAIVLPIADRHLEYAEAVRARLAAAGLRVELDGRVRRRLVIRFERRSCRRCRTCWSIGDREVAEGTVAVRSRTGGDLGAAGRRRVCRTARDETRSRASRPKASEFNVEEVVIAFDRSPRRDDRVRINERIRVREIRVIDDDGQQLGIMPPPQALALARSKGLDLVEISPTAVPPVCRIMDFGKYQYEQQKRARRPRSTRR